MKPILNITHDFAYLYAKIMKKKKKKKKPAAARPSLFSSPLRVARVLFSLPLCRYNNNNNNTIACSLSCSKWLNHFSISLSLRGVTAGTVGFGLGFCLYKINKRFPLFIHNMCSVCVSMCDLFHLELANLQNRQKYLSKDDAQNVTAASNFARVLFYFFFREYDSFRRHPAQPIQF